jgi:glycine cleavage system H lipoate-binding protein
VTAANEKVTSDPSVVNTDAEKDGWLFKIKIQDAKDLGKYHVYIWTRIDELMSENDYRKFVEENKDKHWEN